MLVANAGQFAGVLTGDVLGMVGAAGDTSFISIPKSIQQTSPNVASQPQATPAWVYDFP